MTKLRQWWCWLRQDHVYVRDQESPRVWKSSCWFDWISGCYEWETVWGPFHLVCLKCKAKKREGR